MHAKWLKYYYYDPVNDKRPYLCSWDTGELLGIDTLKHFRKQALSKMCLTHSVSQWRNKILCGTHHHYYTVQNSLI